MKNFRIGSLVSMLLVLCFSVTLLGGCGTASPKEAPKETPKAQATAAVEASKKPAKQIDIRVMSAYTAGTSQYALFNKLMEDITKEMPNVKISHDGLPTKDLRTKLTVEMAAGNPPDVSWCVLNYAREFMRDNKIMDWKPVFEDPKHPEFKQWFDTKALNFASYKDGRIMMAPIEASIDGLFYNKEMFDKYGWQPPKTFDELLALAKKTKEKNIALMVTGGKDLRFAWLAAMLLVRSGGLNNANALTVGDAMDKWDDPKYGFVDAMKKFKQMVDAGVFPQGVLGVSSIEADQMFARGEAAMFYEGAWKPGNFKTAGGDEFLKKLRRVDFPAMPDMPNGDAGISVGGNIIGFIIANNLAPEKQELCIKIAKEIVSPRFNVPVMETGGFVYAGKANYDKSKVAEVFNQCVEAYHRSPNFMPAMDAIAPPSVDLAIKQTAMPGIIAGQYNVEKAVAEVQKAAADYMKAQKK